MASSGKSKGGQPAKSRRVGFFGKLKQALTPGSSDRSVASKTRSREDDRESFGTTTTRTRSRMSVFGASREAKEAQEAERQLEERKAKCVAIKAAKRDPPGVQRLLVDCEFCNPPPQFGRDVRLDSPAFTSAASAAGSDHVEALRRANADLSDERSWNYGVDEWFRMREWWRTPTAEVQPEHHLDADLTPDRYYTVYDKMVYKTRPLKHPLNLADVAKIVKAGWVGEGTWPPAGDNDVWSTSDEQKSTSDPVEAAPATISSATQTSPCPQAILTAPAAETDTNKPAHTGPAQPPGEPPQSTVSSRGSSNPPRIHVQFSNKPHPREKEPGDSMRMPRLERVQSSIGVSIRPVRSAHSSIVSITDSD